MQDTIKRLRDKKDDEGFTLIELLVVVVIIGVLVAIAVPVYLNYRQGAADKSAESDVRGGVSALEQFYTNNSNKYPADIAATTGTNGKVALPAIGSGSAGVITVSDGTSIEYKNVGPDVSYILCGNNANGTTGKVYIYNSAATGSGSVKTSTQITLALCISTGT